jgi:hypothetical protein
VWSFGGIVKKLKILCCIALAFCPVLASSVLDFSVEAMHPTKKSYFRVKDRHTFWGIATEYGWLFNEHFVLGPKVDFSWNLEKERITDQKNTSIVTSKERVIMVPLSIFFIVDPIPKNMIHPVFHAQIGYNSVFISNVDYDKNLPDSTKENINRWDGYYNGLYTKFGFDCMIDVGKQTSIFVGPQWQISTTERRKKDTSPYERTFNGFGIRFGVSTLL